MNTSLIISKNSKDNSSLLNKNLTSLPSYRPAPLRLSISDTAITDTGDSDIYVTPTVPVCNINPHAPTSHVGDASGRVYASSASANLNLPNLPSRSCQVMPTFQHNLIGIGTLCDHGCKVLFDSNAVTVFSKDNQGILLKGWQETTGAKLWRFSLQPEDHPIPSIPPSAPAPPAALNAHDLPSFGALVRYLHAAAGFPVKSTWLAAIKDVNL